MRTLLLLAALASNPPQYDAPGGSATGASASTNWFDDTQTQWGTSQDFVCEYDTAQTPDAMVCGIGTDSRAVILMEKADVSTDMGHAQQTNPTLFVHSSDSSDTTQWISIAHNQTNAVLDTGKGTVSILDGVLSGGDVELSGDMQLSNTGQVIEIGAGCATGHALGANTTEVCSTLEVDGLAWLDGGAAVADAQPLAIGSGGGGGNDMIVIKSLVQTPDSGFILPSELSRGVIIAQNGDQSTDFAHAQQTNPTLYIQSADQTNVAQWISIAHNQTNGIITAGTGGIQMASVEAHAGTTISPAAAATTFAITQNIHKVDCDGGGNTIATITGGVAFSRITLWFVDASCTITDTNDGAANTVDLSAAFTSADDVILELVYDGTSWLEISRTAN